MRPIRITENVYLVNGGPGARPRDCCVYAVLGEKPVLIDCGSGEAHDAMIRCLGKIGADPAHISCVIGTHCHYDHLAGISAMRRENPGIRLIVHEADADKIENADHEATCADWMFRSEIEPERVDVSLSEDGIISEGGRDFEIIHTPGHSPGSICVRLETGGKKLLFTGDCFVPGNEKVLGDYDSWMATLEKLLDVDFDILLPGHSFQWIFNPFYSALLQDVSKDAGKKFYKFVMDNFSVPFWKAGILNYSYILPPVSRISDIAGRLFFRR